MANQFNPRTWPTDFAVFPGYFRARPAAPHGFEPVGPLPPPTAAVPPVADPPRTGLPFDASTPTRGIGSAVPLSSDGPTYAQTEELLTLLRELVAAVNRIGR
jgi:hypothetical protein